MRDAGDYVGIPWRDQGCGRDGCNCWGLVRLIYRLELGIELPAFSDRVANDADREAIAAVIAGERSRWDLVERSAAALFDVVIMRDAGVESHIGIVCGPGRLLHVPQGGASMIQRMGGVAVRSKIAGVFRYRAG